MERLLVTVPPAIPMVALVGAQDANILEIEAAFPTVNVTVRGNEITLRGPHIECIALEKLLNEMMLVIRSGQALTVDAVKRSIAMLEAEPAQSPAEVLSLNIVSNRGRTIRPKTANQKLYVDAIETNTITFGIGPAGTGKTYLAMAKAVRSVADALAPFCSSTNVPESPFVLHLLNVMHLATDVTGVLNDSAKPTDIFTLISELHPSAAVCGTPTDKAKDLIVNLEEMNRGRYAGPVGWIDVHGDGEIAIALRCGQITDDKKSIRIFAGCGIVAGSDPEKEYAESQAKLIPMRTALETL